MDGANFHMQLQFIDLHKIFGLFITNFVLPLWNVPIWSCDLHPEGSYSRYIGFTLGTKREVDSSLRGSRAELSLTLVTLRGAPQSLPKSKS